MNELRALTGARGIAAWLVVLFHVRAALPGLPPFAAAVIARGYLAVDFFFLLSGFVIWLSWHQRLRDGDPASVVAFLHKRVARIWPLNLVMLAFAVALALLLATADKPDPAFPFAELPFHLLLVQNWGLPGMLRWNDPAWSISCELAAYLLFPLLALAIDWRRLPAPALIAIGAAMLLALHVIMAGHSGLNIDTRRFGLARCLTEFGAGTIVAALFLRQPLLLPWLLAAAAGVLAWSLGAPETLVAPATFAALLLVLALTSAAPLNPLTARAIHYLGEISYATYLSHYLLWKAFKLVAVNDIAAIPPWRIAVYLALVLAASVALYHAVERPAQRWINALRWRS